MAEGLMCPTRGDLERAAAGYLPSERSEAIAEHLLDCDRCVTALEALDTHDPLIESVRRQPATLERWSQQGVSVEPLVARVRGLVGRPVEKAVEPTWPSAAASEATPSGHRPEADSGGYRFLASAELPDEIGRLGGYRVLGVLGSGGMGVVFEAEDPQLKRRVALKVMKPDLAVNTQSRQRFLREAQTLAAIDHDHVVAIYQVGEDAGVPFIAMPFLQGESLDARLKRVASLGNRGPALRGCRAVPPVAAQDERQDAGNANCKMQNAKCQMEESQDAEQTPKTEDPSPKTFPLNPKSKIESRRAGTKSPGLPIDEVLRIGREVAEGLAAAHARGLIHRDIKPGNIWLESGRTPPRVKLLDFGLARPDAADVNLTQSAAVLGTPSYMAPEQARGEAIDARADLFSLGCVLYRMATGRPPFPGNNPLSVLMSLAINTPPAPRELNPEVPPELNALIISLLSKDPAGRPQSAREVADRLQVIGDREQQEGSGFGVQGNRLTAGPTARADSEIEANQESKIQNPESNEGGLNPPAVIHQESLVPTTAASPAAVTNSDRAKLPPRWRFGLICAGAAAVLLAGIVIVIKNENGETVARIEGQGDVDISGLAPGHTLAVEQTAEVKAAKTKTQDLNPKTSSLNPKSKIENPKSWHGWPTDAPAPAIAPFDADQARKHQQEWADYLKLPLEYTNSIGMKFVLIPPGEFMMGSTPEEIEEHVRAAEKDYPRAPDVIRSEAPRHKVVITKPVYLGIYEVTQKEYEIIAGQNPSLFSKNSASEYGRKKVEGLDTSSFPVDGVTWLDATDFCAKLSRQEGLNPFYLRNGHAMAPINGDGYRLPTEAEWEFACRAGTDSRFWSGDMDEQLFTSAWIHANSDQTNANPPGPRTHTVGELLSNPFGLFDVHGNVAEWVQDGWSASFYGKFADATAIDPVCPFVGVPKRVIRGGSVLADGNPIDARSSHRILSAFNYAADYGFRVVLALDALRGKSLAAKPTDSRAPDRDAAEWVFKLGGRMMIDVDHKHRWVSARAELPAGPWTGFAVDLSKRKGIDRDALARVARLEGLTKLYLGGSDVSDDALIALADRQCEWLDLSNTTITGKGLKHISGAVMLLNIAGSHVTDVGLEAIQQVRGLEYLAVDRSQLTAAGVVNLARLLRLRELDMLNIGNEELVRVASLDRLTKLTIRSSSITDTGFKAVEFMKGLHCLEMWDTPLNDAQLGRFVTVPSLESLLFIRPPDLNQSSLAALARLKTLTNLQIADGGLTGDDVASIGALKKLEILVLDGNPITDAALKHLYGLTKLNSLNLTRTKVTSAGVTELQAALPNCWIDWTPALPPPTGDPNRDAAEWVLATGGEVTVMPPGASNGIAAKQSSGLPPLPWHLDGALLRGPGVHEDDFARLAGLAGLRRIEISNCNISGGALERVGKLPGLVGLRINGCAVGHSANAWMKNFPNLSVLALWRCNVTDEDLPDVAAMWQLRYLELHDNPGITDKGLGHLTELRGLQELGLNGTAVTDAGLQHLRQLKQLKLLSLDGTTVGDRGLVALGELVALTRLGLAGTRITDAGLPALSNLKKLKILGINDTIITDVGLAEIAKLNHLESLNLRGTRISDDGLAELKALAKLQDLFLPGTEVTDNGLKHLHGMTNLKHLDVTSTRITAAGVAELKAALPNCQVIHDPAAGK